MLDVRLRLHRRPKLAARVVPVSDRYPRGGPILLRVEIANPGSEEVELRAVGIPWLTIDAIRFEANGFHPAWREGLPQTRPSVRIPPGATVSGEVDLAQELVDAEGRSIAEHPGEHRGRAKVVTAVARYRGEDDRLELDVEPFVVRIEETERDV